MFRVMELPVMMPDAHVYILNCSEHRSYEPDSREILQIRRENITAVGTTGCFGGQTIETTMQFS